MTSDSPVWASVAAAVVDPVCGMTITPAEAVDHDAHDGQTHVFCSKTCLERFRADPASFGTVEPVVTAPAPKTQWICPMHPNIIRAHSGSCPVCGMGLESQTVALDDKNPELDDMTRRFRVSLWFTAPIFAFMVSTSRWSRASRFPWKRQRTPM